MRANLTLQIGALGVCRTCAGPIVYVSGSRDDGYYERCSRGHVYRFGGRGSSGAIFEQRIEPRFTPPAAEPEEGT